MRVWQILLLGGAILSLTGATEVPPLESYAANCADLVKITPNPLKMNPVVAMACASAAVGGSEGIHTNKFFDVYVSYSGASMLKTGKGTYPENTVVVKRKYSDADGLQTELYTGMIKRGKGYNPQGGDWEYFVVSGDGKKVTQSGALTSCMQCHQDYAGSDYVTRAYLTEADRYHSGEQK